MIIPDAQLILTCEHAVNAIPKPYQGLFEGHQAVLETHRGIDIGALTIAEHLSQHLNAPLFQAEVSRLLIDCNRSLTHATCFSEFTQLLSPAEKQGIIDTYYLPYRSRVQQHIEHVIDQGKTVIHLSIHSFTPVLKNITRKADIAFLYDPSHIMEKILSHVARDFLLAESKAYRIRMNYPYRGTSDGFTQTLRRCYSEEHYIGIEVEHNQALLLSDQSRLPLLKAITNCLEPMFSLS